MNGIVAAVAAASRTLACHSQTGPPASPAGSGTGAQSVFVYFVLTDNKERPAPGTSITKDELRVEDEGKPAEVLEVRRADSVPMRFVLLLDLSASNLKSREEYMRRALEAIELLQRTMRPGIDQAFVSVVRGAATTSLPLDPEQLPKQLRDAQFGGGTALYDAVVSVCGNLASGGDPGARRFVLAVTDGEDNLSTHTLEEAKEAAVRARVTIYWVDPGWRDSGHGSRLGSLSLATGGRAFWRTLDGLAGDLRSQYVLTFRPSAVNPGSKPRKLRITAPKGSKLRIQAPAWYYAPPN